MPGRSPDALVLSGRVLRVLTALNLLAGVLIVALLLSSLVEPRVFRALGVRLVADDARLFTGMRLIMVLGVVSVAVVHVVLTRLRAIVETVSSGDAFVLANATRLTTIAWAILALELLHFAVGTIAASVSSATAPLDLSRGFSLTRWLAVLMCFVIARVFEQGARMRDDLEGTV